LRKKTLELTRQARLGGSGECGPGLAEVPAQPGNLLSQPPRLVFGGLQSRTLALKLGVHRSEREPPVVRSPRQHVPLP